MDNTSNAALDFYRVGGSGYNYGTAEQPRMTVPTNLPAGSVVEVHGGPYWIGDFFRISGQGTAEKPIFIRGIDKPRFAKKLSVYSASATESKYMVLEGLDLYKFEVIAPASYISLRDCNVQGDLSSGGIAIDSYNAAHVNHHLVFYRNEIHDNGDWQADFDQDVHGITVARDTNNVWIVDNEMYHNSGDGLQINAGSLQPCRDTHHIYVGRNLSHHNKQAGLWYQAGRGRDLLAEHRVRPAADRHQALRLRHGHGLPVRARSGSGSSTTTSTTAATASAPAARAGWAPARTSTASATSSTTSTTTRLPLQPDVGLVERRHHRWSARSTSTSSTTPSATATPASTRHRPARW